MFIDIYINYIMTVPVTNVDLRTVLYEYGYIIVNGKFHAYKTFLQASHKR